MLADPTFDLVWSKIKNVGVLAHQATNLLLLHAPNKIRSFSLLYISYLRDTHPQAPFLLRRGFSFLKKPFA